MRQKLKKSEKKFEYEFNYNILLNILSNLRKTIADNFKHIYRSNRIGDDPSTDIIIEVDESLFVHDEDGAQIWIVSIIQKLCQKKRFDIIPHRNSPNLKLLTMNHILQGTHITHYGWVGFNFFWC